ILRLRAGVFEVLATNGDTRLGGDDLDARLAERILADLPADLRSHPQVRAQVLQLAEQTKRTLTDREQTEVVLGLPNRGEVGLPVPRAAFEAPVRDVVERTSRPVRKALKDAGIPAAELTNVIAVGGSTRVPLVRRHMEKLFGRPPLVDIDPDQVVAL